MTKTAARAPKNKHQNVFLGRNVLRIKAGGRN